MVVHLNPHDPTWSKAFVQEAEALSLALGAPRDHIHHIGSTAIPAILAKPIIDILCVVTSLPAVDAAESVMQGLGYKSKGENGIPGRRYFQKLDPATGARTHHVHVFQTGDDPIRQHLAFRDYLRAHPEKAAEYSDLKASILARSPPSRSAYQELKSPFIVATQRVALEWFDYHRQSGAGSETT